MILLHHPEVELSRSLLAALPEGCAVVDWAHGSQRASYAGPEPSALPSVAVEVPAYSDDLPVLGPDGEFLGMARGNVVAHQEALRLPASWQAVDSFVAFVEDRARLQPVL